MAEESTTPDLVELTRRAFEAGSNRDLDAVMSFYGPDSVWDMSQMGLGTYHGLDEVRGFFADWLGSYEEFEMDLEELLDFGNGVVFYLVRQSARLVGSTGRVDLHYAGLTVWVDGIAVRVTNYADPDEGRAAAERLAVERG